MTSRKHFVALLTAVGLLVLASTASAAFPNFTGCPREAPNFAICLDVQNTSGALNIKGFNVPLGPSLEIRGAVTTTETGNVFLPARGTNGFIGQPVPVPGGLLGIEWIPGTSVLAITELAGAPSAIHFEFEDLSITVPVKVRLVNALIGMNCHIGTDRAPVRLHLIIGTTSPPPPNRPISGHPGTFTETAIVDNFNVENSFAVPGATECGLGLGLINALVNAKLRLPSAAGNNAIEIHNNIAISN